MSYLAPPQPDEPQPPGVEPNKPKDRSVYGGHWGKTGDGKQQAPPPDRPDRIEAPAEEEGTAGPDQPAPTDDH